MTKTDLINLFKQANKTPRFTLPKGYGRITKHNASKKGYKHIVNPCKHSVQLMSKKQYMQSEAIKKLQNKQTV